MRAQGETVGADAAALGPPGGKPAAIRAKGLRRGENGALIREIPGGTTAANSPASDLQGMVPACALHSKEKSSSGEKIRRCGTPEVISRTPARGGPARLDLDRLLPCELHREVHIP